MSREELEAEFVQVWATDELRETFTVDGFLAPYVSGTRKIDGAKGSLMFQHEPRFYFSFAVAS
jgi:hypothetical protein